MRLVSEQEQAARGHAASDCNRARRQPAGRVREWHGGVRAHPPPGGHGEIMPARHALIVDDDADGREALAQLLETQGYAVRQAENGRVALDILGEWLPCLMLLDLEMPVMSGWEVLDCLQPDGLREVAVVVLSAAESPPPDVRFVRKPCEISRLLEAIRACDASGVGGRRRPSREGEC